MAHRRDVDVFDRRAAHYEHGRMGRWHGRVTERTIDVALRCAPAPGRVLDVGCGTGSLVRRLALRCPGAVELEGVDPAPGMVEVATGAADDRRVHFSVGFAERLPYPDASFDLVLSTVSFHHWEDQEAGLRECARVLAPGGHLVLTDFFSVASLSMRLLGRRRRAGTVRRAGSLLGEVGFGSVAWHRLSRFPFVLRTVTATR